MAARARTATDFMVIESEGWGFQEEARRVVGGWMDERGCEGDQTGLSASYTTSNQHVSGFLNRPAWLPDSKRPKGRIDNTEAKR